MEKISCFEVKFARDLGMFFDKKLLKSRSFSEQLELINKASKFNYPDSFCIITVNRDVLKYRTASEQLEIMDIVRKYKYSSNIMWLLIGRHIKRRTFSDTLVLLERFDKSVNNRAVLELCMNLLICEHTTLEEHIEIIDTYIKLDYNEYALFVANDYHILTHFSACEQIKIMEKITSMKGLTRDELTIITDTKLFDRFDFMGYLDYLDDFYENRDRNVLIDFNQLLYLIDSGYELDKILEMLPNDLDVTEIKISSKKLKKMFS